jgi:phosphoribosylpyrophosphate synthetase
MTTPLIQTIFHRKYDIICPLPSSKGPASDSNMRCAMMLSKAFGGGMNNGPPVEFAINRHSPLLTKSTQTSAEIRRNIDAPRIMHFSTMSVEKSLLSSIKGKKILLYDDVITWGNTSEAARNLLLILGASEVDVFCVFGTGPSLQQNVYEFEPGNDSLTAEELICSSNMSPKYFKLKENTDLKKHILCWEGQKNLKEWNEHFGRWIADFHPEYVPNDIPF